MPDTERPTDEDRNAQARAVLGFPLPSRADLEHEADALTALGLRAPTTDTEENSHV